MPHLTQDTIRESDKNTRKHHITVSQEVSPFPAGDDKSARNRPDSMTKTNRKHKLHKGYTKKHRLGMTSKKVTGGLNRLVRKSLAGFKC